MHGGAVSIGEAEDLVWVRYLQGVVHNSAVVKKLQTRLRSRIGLFSDISRMPDYSGRESSTATVLPDNLQVLRARRSGCCGGILSFWLIAVLALENHRL